MNLPMPNDKYNGATVIASCWFTDTVFTLLLLMPEKPHYSVEFYDEFGACVGGEVFTNIVYATHFYREETGCV